MAIKSNRDGSCYDCGKEWKEGDEIDANGHKTKAGKDYWCKDGKNCMGQMQLGISDQPVRPQQSIPQSPRITIDEIKEKYEALDDQHKLSEVGISIKTYLYARKMCEGVGITEPPVIGMIFNKAMDRLN